MHDLWVEKYRPDTFDGYVFKDASMSEQFLAWIANEDGKRIPIPHLLFSGSPGTGKTTIARILINMLGVDSGDLLDINASRENGVDIVRSKIINFCSTWAIGSYKIVFLDEVDKFSFDAQQILRAEIEKYSDSVRFILTCNYPHKIIPALHSRMQTFHIDKLDLESFMNRMITILEKENVEFDFNDIEAFVNYAYPDLRKCINLLDQNTRGGKLHALQVSDGESLDYMNKFVELFMAKQFTQARQYICSIAKQDDFETIYKFFYKNLQMFSATEEGQKLAILAIANGLRNHTICADSEINLAATIISLSEIQ